MVANSENLMLQKRRLKCSNARAVERVRHIDSNNFGAKRSRDRRADEIRGVLPRCYDFRSYNVAAILNVSSSSWKKPGGFSQE